MSQYGRSEGGEKVWESDRSERQDEGFSTYVFSVNYANRCVSSSKGEAEGE